jgi:hypothetical protein
MYRGWVDEVHFLPHPEEVAAAAMAHKKKWSARSGQAANQAVGLFNPMRFLHSMDTWKKAETEV